MDTLQVVYGVQNPWASYSVPSQGRTRYVRQPEAEKMSKWQIAGLVLGSLFIIGFVAVLVYLFVFSKSTADTVTADSTLFPYGPQASDSEVTNDDPVIYTLDSTFTYTLFGNTPTSTTMAVQPTVLRGNVFVGEYTNDAFTTSAVKVLVHGAIDFKRMDRALGEHFYHRKATASDIELINCIIPNFVCADAYIFTWVNIVAYDTNTYIYTKIGTFQAVVAFDADSIVYVIRNYGDNIQDASGAVSQFKTYDLNSDTRYDLDLVSDDVRGQRIINPLSEAVTTTEMPRVEQTAVCPT